MSSLGPVEHLLGSLERGAVGQLHGGDQIALVLDRQEAGRHPRQAVAADPDQHQCERDRHGGVPAQEGDQPRVAALDAVIDSVEAAVEEIALLRRHRRPQPERALRRLQRRRVDGGQQRGRRDHQRELRIDAPGEAGEERGRQEHRDQHQGDADDRREQLVHRLDRGVVAVHALLDVVRGAFHHDDGVVDDDADREHDREQRRHVDGEAERRHRGERADDRHRHGRRRHQHRAPVLQEHQDHDQHQQAGLDQRHVDLVHRGFDEFRGVERRVVLDAFAGIAWRAPPSSSRRPARPGARWRPATGTRRCRWPAACSARRSGCRSARPIRPSRRRARA